MNMCSTDGVLKNLRDILVDSFLSVFGSNLVSLVLFGSYARGEPKPESDIDVVIVLDRVSDRYVVQRDLDRVEEVLKPFLLKYV